MLVASAGVVVAANWIGKAKTFTTMVAICLFIVADAPALSGAQPWFAVLSWVVMAAAVVLTVVSMVDYFAHSWPLLADGHERPRASADSACGGARFPGGTGATHAAGRTSATSALEGDARARGVGARGGAGARRDDRDRGVVHGRPCRRGADVGARFVRHPSPAAS